MEDLLAIGLCAKSDLHQEIAKIYIDVTLNCYTTLVRDNSFMNPGNKWYKKATSIMLEQLACALRGDEANWHGYVAFNGLLEEMSVAFGRNFTILV